MRTAKERVCNYCHATVKRLTAQHVNGLCITAVATVAAASTHKRKTVLRDCPGCGKPFGRLRKSGLCKSCESTLPEAQRASIEAAKPEPKAPVVREVTVGQRFRPASYFAVVMGTSIVDDETVVEYRLNGGAPLYATLGSFLSKFQPV